MLLTIRQLRLIAMYRVKRVTEPGTLGIDGARSCAACPAFCGGTPERILVPLGTPMCRPHKGVSSRGQQFFHQLRCEGRELFILNDCRGGPLRNGRGRVGVGQTYRRDPLLKSHVWKINTRGLLECPSRRPLVLKLMKRVGDTKRKGRKGR